MDIDGKKKIKMRNKPLPGLCKKSPIHQDVDTKWADKVYNKEKVDRALKKSGHHTEGSLRGQENTSPGQRDADVSNAMIDTNV